MNKYLEDLALAVRDGCRTEKLDVLSTEEHIYVCLCSGRYDLLPEGFSDPFEAWFRLSMAWRQAVCRWRGLPDPLIY